MSSNCERTDHLTWRLHDGASSAAEWQTASHGVNLPSPHEHGHCPIAHPLWFMKPLQLSPSPRLPFPCPPQSYYPFHWDGTNTHAGRLAAARKLSEIFLFITMTDPLARIHCVAHSHGGNVLLKVGDMP